MNTVNKKLFFFIGLAFLAPFLALAINDVSISDDTDFELNTLDTAVLTTITATAGGQVTNLDIESNYIDITLENASNLDFSVAEASRYFTVTKQSGSDDYTVGPTCPTDTVSLVGSGAQVVLRLKVQTTDSCITPPLSPSGSGSGGSPQINGTCGLSHGATFSSKPTVNLCSAGTATEVSGDGPWTWDCLGQNHGFDNYNNGGLACSANLSVIAPPAPVIPVQPAPPVVPIYPIDCKLGDLYSSSTGLLCASIPIPPLSYITFTRNLTLGSTGSDVLALQRFLNVHGFTVSASGPGSLGNESNYFGALTKSALAKFQAANGIIPSTGYFGPITRTLINKHIDNPVSVPIPMPTLSTFTRDLILGSVGEDVRALQHFLNTHGFIISFSGSGSLGNESNYFGILTQAALAHFQAVNGIIPSTGYFGPKTRLFLKLFFVI